MTKPAIKFALAFCSAIFCVTGASGQKSHCQWFTSNIYLNPIRIAILRSRGILNESTDGTYIYATNIKPLVKKPVTCKLILTTSGEVANLSVLKSSGEHSIDETAMLIVRQAAPFKLLSHKQDPFRVSFRDSEVVVTRMGDTD